MFRIGWHREWLLQQKRPCAKCGEVVPNDPDCVPLLCGLCLRLFHTGLVRQRVDRTNVFATQSVALDAYLESPNRIYWATGVELTEARRAELRESVWAKRVAAPRITKRGTT